MTRKCPIAPGLALLAGWRGAAQAFLSIEDEVTAELR